MFKRHELEISLYYRCLRWITIHWYLRWKYTNCWLRQKWLDQDPSLFEMESVSSLSTTDKIRHYLFVITNKFKDQNRILATDVTTKIGVLQQI